MTLTRIRHGYAPGSMDPIYLQQDIDELEATLHSPDESGDLLKASSEIEVEARRLGKKVLIAKALIQRSTILRGRGRLHDALDALASAETELGNLRSYDLKVKILAGMAEIRAQLNDWPAVLDVSEKGIALTEANRYNVSGQYLQSSYLHSRISLYVHGVRAAFERNNYGLMLRWAELSKCRSVLRQRPSDLPPGEEELQTEREFLQVSEQIDAARARNPTEQDATLDALLTKRRALWDLLLIERAEARAGDSLPEFDLAAMQMALDEDEAVLYYYWLDPLTLLVVGICRGRLVPALSVFTADERSALEQFAKGLLEGLTQDTPGFLEYVDQLYDYAPLFLPTEVKDLLTKKSRVLISPHRLLHAIPFHALPWDESHRYLIQRFAVSYTPNLTCLGRRYPSPSRQALLALGIHEFRIPGNAMSALKMADAEVREIKQVCEERGRRVQTWCGDEVRKAAVQRLAQTGELSTFTGIHIATHGYSVIGDTPMESHLLLHDAILDGLEIANWRLGADLVVLSACCSGQRAISGRGMDELPGDDLFGLQAAFFAAGARQVIGALWPVKTQEARSIMSAFYRALLAGAPADVALQQAIIEHLKTARLHLRHTYYWAPFFLSVVGRSDGRQEDAVA